MFGATQGSSKLTWTSPLEDGAGPLLLLAGGLGINPLFCILKVRLSSTQMALITSDHGIMRFLTIKWP